MESLCGVSNLQLTVVADLASLAAGAGGSAGPQPAQLPAGAGPGPGAPPLQPLQPAAAGPQQLAPAAQQQQGHAAPAGAVLLPDLNLLMADLNNGG